MAKRGRRKTQKLPILPTVIALVVVVACIFALSLWSFPTPVQATDENTSISQTEVTPEPTKQDEQVEEPIDEEPAEEALALSMNESDYVPVVEDVSWEDAEPLPTPEPTPKPGLQEITEVVESSDPSAVELEQVTLHDGGVARINREEPIAMSDPADYNSMLEGVTTFRGSNYRQNAAYGTLTKEPSMLTTMWSVKVGGYDSWFGVGWTGQPAIVHWDDETRAIMNIKEEKKSKTDLKEVIYAALDGKIHFLDLDDGSETRDCINVGAPIKGSVTVDPRGYPLLYCGQGIQKVNGKNKDIGFRIFSLIDQERLFFLNGVDSFCPRSWYAFDGSCLVDAATDTLFEGGENGVFYSISLNTQYDKEAGTISVDPVVDRYIWYSDELKYKGVENSVAIYNHYGFFNDNSGYLQCVDLNKMKCVWGYKTGDDSDATTAIEETDEGVFLYTGNEIEKRGTRGDCNLRKFNALTGEQLWQYDISVSNDTYGGLYASPVIGQNNLSDLVFFNVSCTSENGTLLAIDKNTGTVVWSLGLEHYSWSTPVAVYSESGTGYLIVGNSMGILRLVDGATGTVLNELDLGKNIEGSPAVYDDMLVVGTRGGRIYGIKIS